MRVAAVLSLLVAISQIALYYYAKTHLKEILQNASVKLFHFITVTESAAQVNPTIFSSVFCLLLAAGCFIGAHYLKKRAGR